MPEEPSQTPDERPGVQQEADASGHGRVYQAGRDQTINEVVLPKGALRPVTEVAAPPGLVNVPAHSQLFVGRAGELASLKEILGDAGAVVVTAVHGLGGVGKSTLAAQHAAQQATRFNPVWWITADTGTAVQAGLAGLAVALQPELGVLPLEALEARALAWLQAHRGWLLVMDDLTDPEAAAVVLDRPMAGRILVTSRLGEGWHRFGAHMLHLDVLSQDEAVALLTRIAGHGRSGGRLEGAAELVVELGCLPLAVEQAGAYLHQARLSAAAYLDLLNASPAVMFDRAARGSDGERTIARIWRHTLDRLTTTPLAGNLLRVLAWYASEQIPRTLLDGFADGPDLVDALGELAAYNMITLEEDGAVSLHRLVQAVARTADPADPHRHEPDITAALNHATGLLNRALPGDTRNPATWPVWRALLPHIATLASNTSPVVDTATIAHLLNDTGAFLYDQGDLARATTYYQRALAAYQRVLGADHPSTLASGNNLASAYRAAGDLGRAMPLCVQTLADRVRVLGADHPDTLSSRSNLADAYRAAGDVGRALFLHEQTLADRVRVLGADHPDTLSSRNNLASAYQAAGDVGRALFLHEQTLADRVRVLGADHPDTLSSRNNLAYAYRAAGDVGRALSLYEQTLADRVRVLGTDHPSTLISRNNLAYAYRAAGDVGRALPLYEQTLADRVRVLGTDHPSTLITRNHLAGAYQAAGDVGRALSLYEQTLADRVRVLGTDHPSTLTSRNHLAYAYQVAGDLARAIPLYEATLNDCERVLGADHPLTQVVRRNLEATR
ncbi:FxSxx-COOH system tetratricopeptide repeat protein [Actinoallomurus oryzae]